MYLRAQREGEQAVVTRCDQRLSEYTANFSQRYVSSYVLFTDYHADLFVDDVHST